MPDEFTFEEATQPTTFSWEEAQGQRLRAELAQVRQEPAALSDPNAPAPSPVSTFQGASETTLMPAGEEYRQFRLPRAGAPGIQPVTTFQGPSEVTLQPEEQARTTGEIMQNTAASAIEGTVSPMTPPLILGTITAPEVAIPLLTATMGKSGSIKLADALNDLQQGRHAEGVQKLGEAATELGFAAAPAGHPSAFAGRPTIEFPASMKALAEQPLRIPVAVPENLPIPEQPLATEVPNASSQQKAAEVYGDLRPRPVEGEGQMPVPQSSGGVQPQAGEPPTAGIRGGEPEAPGPEVPLDPLAVLRAKRAAGEPITAADIDAALRGTAEPPVPVQPEPEPVKPPFRPPSPEPARPPRLPGKPVEEPTLTYEELSDIEAKTARGEILTPTETRRIIKAQEAFDERRSKNLEEAIAALPPDQQKLIRDSQAAVEARRIAEAQAAAPAVLSGPKLNKAFQERYDSLDAQSKADALSEAGVDYYENGKFLVREREGNLSSLKGQALAEAKREFLRLTEPKPAAKPAEAKPAPEPPATAKLKEQLHELGLTDELANKLIAARGRNVANIVGEVIGNRVTRGDFIGKTQQEHMDASYNLRQAIERLFPEPPAPAQTTTGAAAKAEAKAEAESVQKYAREMVVSAGRYIRRSIDSGATPKEAALQWAKEIGAGMADVSDATYKKERGGLYTSTYVKGAFGTKEGVGINAGDYLKAVDAARLDTQKRFGRRPTGASPSPFFPRRSEAQGLGEPALQPTVEDVRRQRAIDQTGVPPPATPEGPGAATPAEFDPTKPFETSIKNAVTDAKRATRGMPAVEEEAARARPEVWEKVKAEIEEDPGLPDRLVAELRDKPRAITDREDAILLHQQISLEELFNRTTQDMVRLADTNSEAIPEYRIRLGQLSDQLLELYDVDKSAGRETARGLAARKMLADETYSLVRMEMAKRAMNDGRPLTDTERTEITALKDKIDATQKAFDEHVAKAETRIRELEAQHAADALKIAAMREAKADAASGTVRDLGAERDSIVAGLGQRANMPLSDLRPWIRKLALNLVRSGITERNALINAVHDVLKDIFPTIERRDTMDAISGYGDFRPLDSEVAKAKLRDLSGQMQNVSKLEDLLGRRALQKTGPERKTLSDEERRLIKLVNEYKKRYGVVVTDPATQLKSALSAVKTRLANQIKDLDFQISTGKKIIKGNTKVAYDAEATALLARRDALKAQFYEVFGKPELTDAQRVEMATKALEKSIEDLQRRIATGDIGPRRTVSKTPVTPELESLRQQHDMAREQLQSLRDLADPKKTPEEISLAALKTRILNSNFELHRRITEGDFTKRTRRSVTLDPESQRLKAENLRLRENFQRDLLKDRLKNRTAAERWQDNLLGFRRFQLLSSPITLAKLTSAAVQRMVFSPIEEAIGAGLGRIPGVSAVARRAPIEGGFSAAAEAKAMTSAFTKGMSDAVQTARTGKSELDLLYGGRTAGGGFKEGALMPPSWMEFFGRLHGALKAPVKRAAFERAMQKQFEFGIRNGIDVTNPITQMSYGVEAFKAGERSIFLQDNVLVSKINSFLATRIDPRTGRPTPSTKAIATAGRVLLPIVRVPTNIVAETMQYATGWATGNVRLGLALRRGIETLQPEEADLIMRQLKKGSIGGAMLIAGYLLPEFIGGYYQPHEKRTKGDVKVGYIGPVPQYVLHNPLLETLQFGSTVRRVADSSLTKRHPEEQGVTAGVLAGTIGLAEEVPALREIIELNKVFDPRERADYFGELTKSLVIPQAVQWLARQMDKDSAGVVIPRKPGTVLEHIQTGIPGQRENVPEPKRRR